MQCAHFLLAPASHRMHREKRQQEEAEALARQEALQRRAEGLRAWMAAVCQKHREERQMRAAAAAAEAAAAAAAAGTAAADPDLVQLASDAGGAVVMQDAGVGTGSSDGGSSGCDSVADSRAASSQAGPGAADWAAASEAAKILQTHFQVARLGLPSSHGQPAGVGGGQLLRAVRQCGKAPRGTGGAGSTSKGPALPLCSKGTQQGPASNLLVVSGLPVGATGQQCTDSARTSSTGRGASICGSGAGGSPQPRRQLYDPAARSSRGDSVTLEDVIEKRLAAAVEAEAADAADALVAPSLEDRPLLPPRPGSAALAAWAAAVSRQQSCAADFAVHGVPGAAAQQSGSAGAAQHQQPQPPPPQQPPQQPAQRQLVRVHVQPLSWQLTPQPWQQQAWDSCGRLQRGGGAPAPTQQPSTAQLPIGSSSSSSRFLDRVATFTQQQHQHQQQLSVEEALTDLGLQGSSSSSSEQVAGEGSSSHGSLGGSGSDQDFAARSADGSVLLPARGSGKSRAGHEAPAAPGSSSSASALDSTYSTYIPPTLLSALHTVRMSPRLLSGLRHGLQGAAPPAPPAPPAAATGQAALQQLGRTPWRGGGASRRQSQAAQPGSSSKQANVAPGSGAAAASPSGSQNGGLGQATLNVPWMMPGPELPGAAAGSPAGAHLASGKSSPAATCVGAAGKAGGAAGKAGGAAVPRPPGPALPRGSMSSPKAPKPAAAAAAGTAALAAGGSPRASGAGGVGGAPRGSQHYRASIEQQAVQSVAALINDMINTRGL